MKHVILTFNPFLVTIGNREYNNISYASKKRLDKMLVNLCDNDQMGIRFYADFGGGIMLVFEPTKEEEEKNDL